MNIHFLDAASAKIPGIHLSFWIVIVIAGVVAAFAGVVIGAPTLRLKSDYLALVTLGFGEILPEVFRNGDDVPPGHLNLTNGTVGIGPVDRVGMGFLDWIPGIPKTIVSSDYRTKYYVILVFCGSVRLGVDQTSRRPSRAGMDGHPRRRAGCQSDGRAADAYQAVVVRSRRRCRRRRWGVLRHHRRHGQRRYVHVRLLDHRLVRGHPGRHGQRVGRDPGCRGDHLVQLHRADLDRREDQQRRGTDFKFVNLQFGCSVSSWC